MTTPLPLPLPRITIVTPSFNQGAFLETAIRSVLDQGYPNLEYIVIDGGSTDGSVDILRKYGDRLAYWVSEPDGGQYEALNKGFARATGEILGWLNSDDQLVPWALGVVGELFARFPQIDWLTSLHPLYLDEAGKAVACGPMEGFSREGFFRGENLPGFDWHVEGSIQQESTFWRRSLWERAGGRLDVSYRLAADFELWARFFRHADLYGVGTPLGGFRMHGGQKTAQQAETYRLEAREAFLRHGGKPPSRVESWFLRKVRNLGLGLLRLYARRLGPLPCRHRCLHRRRGGSWRILSA
jgi:glycosyltransferase involved in cell wall biosynthesis